MHLEPQEKRWLWLFSLLVMFFTSLPYVLGFAMQGTDWVFSGFVVGVEDGNSYIAKMLSGAEGDWLFRTPYTAYPQKGAVVFPLYLLLGKLSSPPEQHAQLVALFHLFRISAGIFAIFATYEFVAGFLSTYRGRRIAVILTSLGGGLGWVLLMLGNEIWLGSLPLEFYSPETFGFLSLFGLPHLSLARGLLIKGLTAYIHPAIIMQNPQLSLSKENLSKGSSRKLGFIQTNSVFGAGIMWLLLGLAQPISVVIAWMVVTVHLLTFAIWNVFQCVGNQKWVLWWGIARRGLWGVLISSPIVIYSILVFSTDEYMRAWTTQNLVLSPHPLHYLLAYGLVIPLALVGARQILSTDPWKGWLPVSWVLLMPILAYAPFNLQRRLPEGVWVVWVILAVLPLESLYSSTGMKRLLPFMPICLALPSTMILLVGSFLTASHPTQPIFRPADEVAAFENLAEISQPGEIVLAAYETGNVLPAWTAQRVLIGHGPESINLELLRARITRFYDANTPETTRMDLLNEFHVKYVFWGPYERALGEWSPEQASYMRLAVHRGEYTIFKVESSGG